MSTIKHYYSDNKLSSLHSYQYDNIGLVSTIDIYYTPFDGGDKLQYTYDSKGNILKESYLNRDQGTTTIQKQLAYQYDHAGRITEYTYNWGSLSFRKLKNYYNPDGRIENVDVSTGDKLDGSFEKRGSISYEYIYLFPL